MHISDVHWIVIEDSNQTYNTVKRILERSKLTHIYFYTIKKTGFPSKFFYFALSLRIKFLSNKLAKNLEII